MPQKWRDIYPNPKYSNKAIKTPNPKPINDIPSSKCGDRFSTFAYKEYLNNKIKINGSPGCYHKQKQYFHFKRKQMYFLRFRTHIAFSVISTSTLLRASNFLYTTVYEMVDTCPFNEELESNFKSLNFTNHHDILTDWGTEGKAPLGLAKHTKFQHQSWEILHLHMETLERCRSALTG